MGISYIFKIELGFGWVFRANSRRIKAYEYFIVPINFLNINSIDEVAKDSAKFDGTLVTSITTVMACQTANSTTIRRTAVRET